MILIKELKSPAKIWKFYLADIAFVIGYWFVLWFFKSSVVSSLQIPYFIFNFAVAVVLVMPSRWNPGKRMWQVIIFMFRKDRNIYKPLSINERSDDFEQDF